MAILLGKRVETFEKPKKKRKGVHAKTKSSKSIDSKLYVKAYKGQGK